MAMVSGCTGVAVLVCESRGVWKIQNKGCVLGWWLWVTRIGFLVLKLWMA